MPRFGDYETTDEIHRSAAAVVWQARASHGRKAELFAVKVCRADEWFESEAGAAHGTPARAAAFAEAAQEMQQMGDHRSDCWVPILAVDADTAEPWYVTRFYPRSLERVIEGRVPIDGPTLQVIVSGIVTGLMDLDRELHRPHGNLRPSNIFFDGQRGLRSSPLLLSDLKPRCELVLPADQVDDFHSLGRTIVQLVRRRRADRNAVIGWPLESSGEWKRLGRHGEAWRELCNGLLNPTPTAAELDLAALQARLKVFGSPRRKPWVMLTLAAVPVCAVIGAGVYLRFTPYERLPERFRNLAESLGNVPPDVDKVPEEWGLLCGSYYDWLGEFLLVTENPVKTGAWSRDPYLQEKVLTVLEDARNRNGSFDPRKFDSRISGSLPSLQANPPEAARRGIVVHKVRDAYGAVRQVQQALVDWPERKKLLDLATRFDGLGCKAPATELRKVAEAAAAPTIKAKAIDQVLVVSTLASRSEALLQELDRAQTVLAGTGDPVLKGVVAFYRSRAESADTVATLNRQLADAAQDVARKVALVQNDWSARIAHDRFLAESFVHAFSGPVDADAIAQWDEAVRSYYFVTTADDPRRTVDWNSRLRAIDESVAALAEEEGAEQAQAAGSATQRFRARAREARTSVDALLAPPVIRKDEPNIRTAMAKLEDDLRRAEADARATLFQLRPDVKEWLAAARSATFGPAGSALARVWDERRSRLLAGADATSLGRNLPAFRELRDKYRRLEEFFGQLAGPQGVGALADFDATGLPAKFAGELKSIADEGRNAAVAELVNGVTWNGDLPRDSGPAYLASAEARAVLTRRVEAMHQLGELAREAQRAADIVGQGGGLADGVADFAGKWRANPLVARAATGTTLRNLWTDVEQLQRLEGESDPAVLMAAAQAQRLGLALAAWRRLGTLANWPEPGALAAAGERSRALQERITREVRDEGRRSALRAALAGEARGLWKNALHQAHDQATVGLVAGRRDEFGVNLRDLSPRERFNLFLWELRQADLRSLAADELEARRNGAVEQLHAMAGPMPDADIRRFADLLAAIALGQDAGGTASLTRLGPGSVGWTGEVASDGHELHFRWRGTGGEHAFVFHLVEGENTAPFFLAAEEVPVGVLMDSLAARRETATRFAPWLNAVTGGDEDQRTGPQLWRYRGATGLRLNDRWTGIPQPSWPKPLYATGVTVAPTPDRELPLQYLPPEAAQYLAREVLGSRLPSPEEWQAAVAAAGTPATGANVRDQNWVRERDYLSAAGVALDSPIDSDIFWPRSLGALKRGEAAQPVAPQADDGYLWFADVERDTQPRFHHLFGNVAEYLYDQAQNKFFVAGGSALSPPEIDPAKPYPVDAALAASGFSDVGLRLAFDAPGSLKARQQLLQLIKNQPFLPL